MMMTKGSHAAKKVAKFIAKPNLPSENSIAMKPSLILNYIAERSCHDVIIAAPTTEFLGEGNNIVLTYKSIEVFDSTSKPRLALLHGGEDDEPIAPQDVHGDMSSDNSNIAAGNSLVSSGLQFGAIYFNKKYSKNMEKFTSAGLSSNIIFRGALFVWKRGEQGRQANMSI
jgi:hypothetical protein